MTTAEHDVLLITLLVGLTAGTGYAAGRLHQWYRIGVDREEAYRDGYDSATRSVFSLAARLIGPRRAMPGEAAAPTPAEPRARVARPPAEPRARVAPPPAGLASSRLGRRPAPDPAGGQSPPDAKSSSAAAAASARDEQDAGRHYVPDALVQGKTYRLPPDRVFRAKVRDALHADATARETESPPSVPRPRAG